MDLLCSPLLWELKPPFYFLQTVSVFFIQLRCEEETLKFYKTSCSFCLCNSACSLQSLDHIGLRKWGLTILGTGAYLTHPCPALCNCPASANPRTQLIRPVCVLKLFNPFVWGSELLWACWRNKPEFSNSLNVVLGFSSTGFCNRWAKKTKILASNITPKVTIKIVWK